MDIITPADNEVEVECPELISSPKADYQHFVEPKERSDKRSFQLRGGNLEIQRGSLVMIVGKVGSEK